MALESATFFVADYKGRHYKIHAVRDCGFGLEEGLWCMVYRCISACEAYKGLMPDANMLEYEEDYSSDFCLYEEDGINLDVRREVELALWRKFNDDCWLANNIELSDEEIDVPDEKEMDAEVKKDILQCKAKKILADYHNLDLENMSVEGALSDLSQIARKMANFIETNLDL